MFRGLIPAALCIVASGCVSEGMHSVELRRESDGAKAICLSNVYAAYPLLPSPAEREARQYVADCVAACAKAGFTVEARFLPTAPLGDAEYGPASKEECAVVSTQ